MLWFLVLEIIGCVLLIFWLWGQKCRSNLLQSLYSAIFVGPHFILIKALNKFGMGRLIPKYVDCVEAVLGNNSPFAQVTKFQINLRTRVLNHFSLQICNFNSSTKRLFCRSCIFA